MERVYVYIVRSLPYWRLASWSYYCGGTWESRNGPYVAPFGREGFKARNKVNRVQVFFVVLSQATRCPVILVGGTDRFFVHGATLSRFADFFVPDVADSPLTPRFL